MSRQGIGDISRRVSYGLLGGIAVFLSITCLIFFMLKSDTQRVPYLNIQVLPAESAGHVERYEETFSRPLFWSNRRPAEVVNEVAVEVPEAGEHVPLEGVRLIGVITQGKVRAALLEVDGNVERASRGMQIKQWTVTDVAPRKVVLANGGKEALLVLERKIHQSIQLER